MLTHPDQLHALIIQNGNIYKADLGAKWTQIAEYWADPKAHPEVLNAFLSFEATKERHIAGTSHEDRYNPDTWISEYADLSRPGQRHIQGQLLYDYRTNVAFYPQWQAWRRLNAKSRSLKMARLESIPRTKVTANPDLRAPRTRTLSFIRSLEVGGRTEVGGWTKQLPN